ncbi:hypothetical protein PG993_014622 [Apiospora rasikravindrae]|uniref:Transcription factor IIA, alpha/beta subunit n=1 Tax=Apiospora rasikravindrae TaxID=990691 RepID=A0ABR1RND0_9PEZI
MSNSAVGNVYQQIILDVIEASRVDLEENGVDESILDELKQGWQRKLTAQQLAIFPWDPKPDPLLLLRHLRPLQPTMEGTQQQQHQQQQHQQQQQQQQQPSANNMPYSPAVNNSVAGDAHIKAEPGVKIEPGTEQTGTNHQAQTAPNELVQQRLANNLRNQFGDRAADTIKNLQAGEARQGVAPQHTGQQRPMGQPANQAQYRQQIATTAAQQVQATAQNGQGQYPPQMDGTAEEQPYSGVLMQRGADGETTELGRVEIDRMLHAAIEAKAKSMEGGGLMLPLKRATKKHASSQQISSAGSGPSRFDGGDDEEDDDEAINSDLDDSDDNGDEEDDDEDGGQIMLCMYDKVQRVKNKWKCVLKDGVLSVNGKDYVFHKATGEYEW